MRLKGQILAEQPLAVIFQVGHKTAALPKSEIRLAPNDYAPGPHTVFLPRWLAQRAFGSAPGGNDAHANPHSVV